MAEENENKQLTTTISAPRQGVMTVAAEPGLLISLRTYAGHKSSDGFEQDLVRRHLIPAKIVSKRDKKKKTNDITVWEGKGNKRKKVIDGWQNAATVNPNIGKWNDVVPKVSALSQASTGNCGPNSVAFIRYGGGAKLEEAPKESGQALTRGALRMLWLDMRAETHHLHADVDAIADAFRETAHELDASATVNDKVGTSTLEIVKILDQYAGINHEGKRIKWQPVENFSFTDQASKFEGSCRVDASGNVQYSKAELTNYAQQLAEKIRIGLARNPAGVMVSITVQTDLFYRSLKNYYDNSRIGTTQAAIGRTLSGKKNGGHWVVVIGIEPGTDLDHPGIPNFKIFDPNQEVCVAHGPTFAAAIAMHNNVVICGEPRLMETAVQSGTSLGALSATRGGIPEVEIVTLPTRPLKADEDATYFNNYIEADAEAAKRASDSKKLVVVIEAPAGNFAVAKTDCSVEDLMSGSMKAEEEPSPEESHYFKKFEAGIASIRLIAAKDDNSLFVGDAFNSGDPTSPAHAVESPSHRTKTLGVYVNAKELKQLEKDEKKK